MRDFFIIVGSLLFLFACNNQSAEPEENQSLADSLFEQVMAGHDVAMPKMNKLERLQREVRAAIDSIAKLPASKRDGLNEYTRLLDSTMKALDYADFAMTQWMGEFKYDSLKNNEPERAKYLQRELEKVNKMKDAVLGSIVLADSVLTRPPAATAR